VLHYAFRLPTSSPDIPPTPTSHQPSLHLRPNLPISPLPSSPNPTFSNLSPTPPIPTSPQPLPFSPTSLQPLSYSLLLPPPQPNYPLSPHHQQLSPQQ
ncbi:hypothetical protein Pmani_040079, partial [Petrolisthes manimaculis]